MRFEDRLDGAMNERIYCEHWTRALNEPADDGREAPEVVSWVILRMANFYEHQGSSEAIVEQMRSSARAVSQMNGMTAARWWRALPWWKRMFLDQAEFEDRINSALEVRGRTIEKSIDPNVTAMLYAMQPKTGPERIREAIERDRGGPAAPIAQGWS